MNAINTRRSLVLLLSLILAACGGGGDGASFGAGSGTGSGSGAGSGSGSGSGGSGATPVPQLGVLSGTFSAGTIAIGQSPLAAGASSGITLDVVDTANGNARITDSVTVSFSSNCIDTGRATLTAVTTGTGFVNGTYIDRGCGGTGTSAVSDVITATATVGGAVISATGTVMVQPTTLGSVQFVSASPSRIGVKGSGQPESSVIVFLVQNATGGPAANQDVTFQLNTGVGGITLNSNTAMTPPATATGKTDASGNVQVTVKAGTIQTAVRVTATAMAGGTTISGQSENLAIGTSIPDFNSFTLSTDKLATNGGVCNGSIANISVLIADRFNNPAPAGTTVAFRTEGGAIGASCVTGSDANGPTGACSVQWRSQNPRPIDGRSTVLATVIGEETFFDNNGDGLFNAGETFIDLPEAFEDYDEDLVRDSGEPFLDFNGDGMHNPVPATADQRYTGTACAVASACDTTKSTLHIFQDLVLTMSGFVSLAAADITITGGTLVGNTFNIPAGNSATINFLLRDSNDQPLPVGTTLAITTGPNSTVTFGAAQAVRNTNSAASAINTYSAIVTANTVSTKDDALTLKLTYPPCGAGGAGDSESFGFIINSM